MDFTELVLAARPNIKPNSAKTYATSLKLLAPEGAADLDFLLDPEPILERLEKYKHTTRRNYLNAIIVVLKDSAPPALEVYEKHRDAYNSEYAEGVQTHSKTERQKEIWIDWPDFLEIVEKLRADAHVGGKSGEWTAARGRRSRTTCWRCCTPSTRCGTTSPAFASSARRRTTHCRWMIKKKPTIWSNIRQINTSL